MALQYITLEDAASAFRVHPRTILRAISKDHNTYWSEDINGQRMAIEDIAKAYKMTTQTLRAVLENRDKLLMPDEVANLLGIRPRTFRDRLIAGRYKRISSGGIVRYLRSKIIEDRISSTE